MKNISATDVKNRECEAFEKFNKESTYVDGFKYFIDKILKTIKRKHYDRMDTLV